MLVNCPNCNKRISDQAQVCPHCKTVLQPKANDSNLPPENEKLWGFRKKSLWLPIAIAVIFAAFAAVSNFGYTKFNSFFDYDIVQNTLACLLITLIISLPLVFLNKGRTILMVVVGLLCVASLSMIGYAFYDRDNAKSAKEVQWETEGALLQSILGQTWYFQDEQGNHQIKIGTDLFLDGYGYSSVTATAQMDGAKELLVTNGKARGLYCCDDGTWKSYNDFDVDLNNGTITINNGEMSKTVELKVSQ